MAPPPTPQQSDARILLDRLLDEYGLGNLKAWAWEQVTLNRSVNEIVTYLYERPEFEARFPAIDGRRKKGLPPITAQEYVAYEGAARQAMRAANMPGGFWDKPADFTQLIVNDVSIDELNTRITAGYQRVAQAPNAVRDAYRSYFGYDGDAALAAHFLDPTRATAVLSDQVRQAEFGGAGAQHGWQISEYAASQWSKRNFSAEQNQAGFARLDAFAPLLDETIYEADEEDFTVEGEGLHVAFGEQGEQEFERRLAKRKALSEGEGQAASDEQGVFGLGQAWP